MVVSAQVDEHGSWLDPLQRGAAGVQKKIHNPSVRRNGFDGGIDGSFDTDAGTDGTASSLCLQGDGAVHVGGDVTGQRQRDEGFQPRRAVGVHRERDHLAEQRERGNRAVVG